MKEWGLVLDGRVRENELDSGITNYVDKYVRTAGNAKGGIYCYNFGLDTKPNEYQPDGAMNLVPFKHNWFLNIALYCHQKILIRHNILFVILQVKHKVINRVSWQVYIYNYDLHIMEERYNMLTFENGTIDLKFSNI